MSDKALQIAVKSREAKGTGEKKRYTHLNAEFQRIPKRDKKAFLSDQRKEIEENNRMGKTRDLFKKIRDTKGVFHAKMGTIKDRNSMDLQKQKILRRGGAQNYPQEKEMEKGKMIVQGGLTNNSKKKKRKRQRRKERYTHLNVEFQRIARRDKEAFL